MRPGRAARKDFPTKSEQHSALARGVQKCILIVALLAGIILAGGFVYYTFFLPTVWDENTTKNIVIVPNSIDVQTSTIIYASFSFKQHRIAIHSLPANDTVQVPGGYGQYPLKSVFPLLALDHTPAQKVIATYSNLIGVPIDDVWATGNADIFSSKLTASQFAQGVLFNAINTGVDLKDRYRLYELIKSQAPTEQHFESLTEWQEKLSSRFAGQLKNCRVALVNTTTVPGLGRRVSSVLERSGVVVVRLTDALPAQEKSQLTIQPDQPDCVALADHMKQLFPTEIEIKQDPQIMSRARSEAEIVIGQDFGNFLGK